MITLIAAIAKNRAIGKDNKLLWRLPNDLRRFKKLTLGFPMIMGSKTYESLGKPLPGRTNIVISRRTDYPVAEGVLLAQSIESAIQLAKKENPETIFIAGGGEIYRQSMDVAEAMELTIIDREFSGDTFFPEWGKEWREAERQDITDDPDVTFTYSFVRFEKKDR